MKEIEALKKDIADLCADMDSFCDVYVEDRSVWQGEAATEEMCYITSDIGEFRKTAGEAAAELDRLDKAEEAVDGEER